MLHWQREGWGGPIFFFAEETCYFREHRDSSIDAEFTDGITADTFRFFLLKLRQEHPELDPNQLPPVD